MNLLIGQALESAFVVFAKERGPVQGYIPTLQGDLCSLRGPEQITAIGGVDCN